MKTYLAAPSPQGPEAELAESTRAESSVLQDVCFVSDWRETSLFQF